MAFTKGVTGRAGVVPVRWCGIAALFLSAALAHAYPIFVRNVGGSYVPGDPIDANSGRYYFSIPLMDLGGPLPLTYTVFYHSDQTPGGAFGPFRFDHNVPHIGYRGITTGTTNLAVQSFNEQDNWIWFQRSNATIRLGFDAGVKYVLQETGASLTNGWYYLTDPAAERMYMFEKLTASPTMSARLRWVFDRNYNRLSYLFVAATNPNPYRIEDGLGRFIDLAFETNLVSRATDPSGRFASFVYSNNLVSALVEPTGGTNRFEYALVGASQGLLTKWTRPLGNAHVTNFYVTTNMSFQSGERVRSQTDAYGNTMLFDYSSASWQAAVKFPDTTTVYATSQFEDGPPMIVSNAAGGGARTFSSDNLFRPRSVMDRLGNTAAVSFETNTSLPAHFTNALGNAIHHSYAAQSQIFTNPANGEAVTAAFQRIVRTDYPDGGFETFTLDERGNVLVHTNRDGQAARTAYDEHGWPTSIVNSATGIVTITWLTNGVVATRQDSETGLTAYQYDALFRVTNTVLADGSSRSIAYDAADRMTEARDELGRTIRCVYDLNGNLVAVTDAAGESAGYGYDGMDRLVAATNRAGGVDRSAYDSNGRVLARTDANGIELRYGYDADGWLIRRAMGGQAWLTARDREGAVQAETTPLGFRTGYGRNALGNIASVTNPLGFASRVVYDAMNRSTAAVDPLGRTNRLAYSSNDLLLAASAHGLGAAVYHRDALGLVDRITDLRGEDWTFAHSPMGRLLSQADPLANTWTYTYDARGRLASATAPDGSVSTNQYNAAGELTNTAWAGGPSFPFAYDVLGSLVAADGVQLQRDAEGRVTNTIQSGISFSAAYDAGGRLTDAGCNNGAVTVSYVYDPTNGLLTGVSDSVSGGGVAFVYDADFRMTQCLRSNGVHAAYTRDAASRLTRLQDGALIDLAYSYDAAGQTTQSVETVPLDPASLLVSATETRAYDAASQIDSAGYAYDSRGRLTAAPGGTYGWDRASRLTNAAGAALEYNGLGRVIARAAGGQTNRFFFNEALPGAPVVAERDGAGSFVRYYVLAPDGQRLYSIEAAAGNQPRYFHVDRNGSTLALTDGSGAVTDAYAYDPYGRLLGHTGPSTQPFTFLGRDGVRREGSGDLYQAGARFYDARAGRFLSREPMWPLLEAPALLNPYQYAVGNPVTFSDPNGMLLGQADVSKLKDLNWELSSALVALNEAEDEWMKAVEALGESQAALRRGGDGRVDVQALNKENLGWVRGAAWRLGRRWKEVQEAKSRLREFFGAHREAFGKLMELLEAKAIDIRVRSGRERERLEARAARANELRDRAFKAMDRALAWGDTDTAQKQLELYGWYKSEAKVANAMAGTPLSKEDQAVIDQCETLKRVLATVEDRFKEEE